MFANLCLLVDVFRSFIFSVPIDFLELPWCHFIFLFLSSASHLCIFFYFSLCELLAHFKRSLLGKSTLVYLYCSGVHLFAQQF